MEERIKELIAAGKRGEAIELLEEYLKTEKEEGLFLQLGELYYADGKLPDALNKFNAVIRINPENKKAVHYVAMIRSVIDYYNKELLNP